MQHYTGIAKLFHWLTAVAVIGLIGLGWYMTSLDLTPLTLKLFSWHKWIGISVLLITILRLIWRFSHPAPPLPADMPAIMRLGAHAGHVILYTLLIALPVIGWIRSSSAGFPVVWFGIVPLPDLVAPDKAITDLFAWLHWAGGLLLVGLLVAHIGAAIWHHSVKRDDILVRMLPGRKGVARLAVLGLVIAVAPPAEAGPGDPWKVDTETSSITFTAKQMNVPVKGTFTAYQAAIVFDAEQPDKASIKLEFETVGVKTGNAQADQALPGAEWFNAAEHPVATFEASGFKPNGNGKFDISGKLSIKGHSEQITIKASIATSQDDGDSGSMIAKASGETTISRTAFKVGEGQWSSTATIADEVVIAFTLNAKRAK